MSSMKANNTTAPSSAYTIHPTKVYAAEKYLLVSWLHVIYLLLFLLLFS